MASLDEMLKAGYTPQKSGVEQIAGLVSDVNEKQKKASEQRMQDVSEQVKLYSTLREAGYSKEDATARVNRNYRSTGFLENILTGQGGNALNPPEGQDKAALEAEKTKSQTALDTAKAKYYSGGGPSAKYANTNLTPNQIQMRIKDLRSQVGMGDADQDSDIQTEIQYLNDLFNKKSGFKGQGEETNKSGDAGPPVVMTGPDGKKYKVPAANVAKAKLRGFK